VWTFTTSNVDFKKIVLYQLFASEFMTSPLSIQCNNMYSPILQCQSLPLPPSVYCIAFQYFAMPIIFMYLKTSPPVSLVYLSLLVLEETVLQTNTYVVVRKIIQHLYYIRYSVHGTYLVFTRWQIQYVKYTKINTGTARTFAETDWMKHLIHSSYVHTYAPL
jgi:hypothetical protein